MTARVLILSQSDIKPQMTGPAIRSWEFAKALAPSVSTTLACPSPIVSELQNQTQAKLTQVDSGSIKLLAQAHDIVIVQGFLLEFYPILQRLQKILIVDLYDPFQLESLENHQNQPLSQQWDTHFNNMSTLLRQVFLADYMLCASEKQKDYWLGLLTACYRINPATYRQGHFEHLLDVVPFGISNQALDTQEVSGVIRGEAAGFGITEDDFVLLWGGGIWDWLDPLTPIKAVAELAKEDPQIKLFFLGVKAPDANVPQMGMTGQAIKLAKELGVEGSNVIFNENWVPYEKRHHYLNSMDVGVSSHFNHLETRFAFRTRVLDYLWAEKPIITTEGDTMADWVSQYQVGEVVGFESVTDWVNAIRSLKEKHQNSELRERAQEVKQQLTWDKVTEPLVTFCQDPYGAADQSMRASCKRWNATNPFPWVQRIARKTKKILHMT